jgi:S1-C subfamily serine protease
VRELGLREGDVVTHINGQALESTEDLREAVDGLRGLDEVSITVERKGSPLQKRYVVD